MSETELYVSKIKDGTVIDHITGGHALDVVKMLGITGRETGTVTIAMNVPSKRFKTKDIVKIEGRELNPQCTRLPCWLLVQLSTSFAITRSQKSKKSSCQRPLKT
jgi:aspartate carbamoyltransferase regulatory subunit